MIIFVNLPDFTIKEVNTSIFNASFQMNCGTRGMSGPIRNKTASHMSLNLRNRFRPH